MFFVRKLRLVIRFAPEEMTMTRLYFVWFLNDLMWRIVLIYTNSCMRLVDHLLGTILWSWPWPMTNAKCLTTETVAYEFSIICNFDSLKKLIKNEKKNWKCVTFRKGSRLPTCSWRMGTAVILLISCHMYSSKFSGKEAFWHLSSRNLKFIAFHLLDTYDIPLTTCL